MAKDINLTSEKWIDLVFEGEIKLRSIRAT